ncbi:MAG: PIG-L deacetylase family protein [Armatimonadota bacterium]
MRVLAVGAHPDDVEILCAGTLAKCAARGDEVHIAVATDGAAGHKVILPPELAEIRRREATAAAQLIGAQINFLAEPDELLFEDERTRLKMIDALRVADPDLIITHGPEDYHPDHLTCSRLVFGASFVSSVPNIKTEHAAQEKIGALYYMDTVAGAGFLPEEYVDITDTFVQKREMLSQHESQLTWLKEHDDIDILEFVETVARFRGLQCGVQYAEGFRAAHIWPRQKAERLLP